MLKKNTNIQTKTLFFAGFNKFLYNGFKKKINVEKQNEQPRK